MAIALVSKGPLARLNKKGQLRQPPVNFDHFSAELGSNTPLYFPSLTGGLGLRGHSLEYLPLCICLGFVVSVPIGRDWEPPARDLHTPYNFSWKLLLQGEFRETIVMTHCHQPSPKGKPLKDDHLLLKQ